jgi:two-component system, chemotaxis family, response regulator Rcp1
MTVDVKPKEVLLVEDNESDVVLTRQGFSSAKLPAHLYHVWDGEECLQFLRKEGKFQEAPTPDLILMDINMPRMDGRQAMKIVGSDPKLCQLPVVVLTTSSAEHDVLEMFRLGANSYVVKPLSFFDFTELLQELTKYWFEVSLIPQES